MATITGLEEKRGRYEIWLDGTLWLRIPVRHFHKMPLSEGEYIDPDAYIDRIAALQGAECYEAALTILDSAAQTRSGMARALMRRGYVRPAAEAAADRLAEIGLIDDQRYAERIAQASLNKPVGAFAVRQKLRAKRISEDDIDSAMECFDDAQQQSACFAAAEKLYRKYAQLPRRESRAKLSQALARRGFGWDAISTAVERILNEADEQE